jgi:CubicO group peptidase (beta-lactamase class C family)
MELSRRHLIGAGAAAAGLACVGPRPAWAAAAQGLAPVVERVRAFAEADLAAKGFPGMQIALVGPGGASAAFGVGLADLDARIPATADQLFQIGSISKSLVVMALFVLADRGRLDLAARVKDLLPEVPLPPEPITVAQLIEHSSGLPNGVGESLFPKVPGGRFWTGFEPGSRFAYCNTGYNLLGHIVARTAGMPFDRALATLVLRPLGMISARPVIRMADRAAYATGHVRLREDIPWLPGAPLAEARWMDFTNAAGSVAATAPDMVRYLRFVVQLGQGKGDSLFSDAMAQRYRTATIDTDTPGERYGHGLRHRLLEGEPVLRHTGGMIAFSSAFTVDPAAGVGAYASVNIGAAGGYRPTELTSYAIALLRAAAAGRPLPDVATPGATNLPEALAKDLPGRWLGADGGDFTIAHRSGALYISSGGLERRLMPSGSALVTDHPGLAPFLIARHEGPEPMLRLGARLFGRDRAPAQPPASARTAVLAGSYFAPEAWSSWARLHAVGDRLYSGALELREAPDGSWRFADPGLASERIWFQDFVDGRPQTLNASGVHFDRQSMS